MRIAGGEGSHNEDMARHMIDHGGVGFIQIDAGRIGGISPAKRVADYALQRGVTYVNHTFTSHLALSASLQPYAGHPARSICEYPVELKSLAWEMTREHIIPDANGLITLPEAPGLGMTPDLEAAKRYLLDVEIAVGGQTALPDAGASGRDGDRDLTHRASQSVLTNVSIVIGKARRARWAASGSTLAAFERSGSAAHHPWSGPSRGSHRYAS